MREAAHGPGVLRLDEPTANLDLGRQLDAIAAAKSRADRGAAAVAILHDLNLAALLAKRLAVLNRGPIDSDGPADQVITDPMLGRVFGVADAVACIPAQGTPFVLPHGAHKLLLATP
ncbi:MAG: hypothetical protein ACXU9D_23025 [Xanthobacteraceae bacterium]